MLDRTNRALIEALIAEPGLSRAELARRVDLSAPAVGDRLARLEADGVIRRVVAIDAGSVGLPLAAWVRVRPVARQLPKVAALAAELPEVVICDRVTGEDCFLLKLHVRDLAHLEELLDRFLLYGQTTSSLVVASPVPSRPVGLPEPTD